MTGSNRSFFKFLKPSKNGHSPNGVGDLPDDWGDFLTSIEMRERRVGVETDEVDLHGRKVDIKLKVQAARIDLLMASTVLGGQIVFLLTNPALFVLNAPAFLAYRWWRGRGKPPDEHGGGP
jgi:hypothetical protein